MTPTEEKSNLQTDDLMKMLEKPEGLSKLSDYPFYADTARELFAPMLSRFLAARQLHADEVARELLLSRSYIYQLLQGGRTPSREITLRLAFFLGLTLEETQRFLRAAQRGALYPNVYRDMLLIHGLTQRLSLNEMQALLQAVHQEPFQ